MVFGLPFASADEKIPIYEFNPRPYDVVRVLLTSVRGRTSSPPTLQAVRPPGEILHRLEQGWEFNWECLPSQHLFPDVDLFQLLAVSLAPKIQLQRSAYD